MTNKFNIVLGAAIALFIGTLIYFSPSKANTTINVVQPTKVETSTNTTTMTTVANKAEQAVLKGLVLSEDRVIRLESEVDGFSMVPVVNSLRKLNDGKAVYILINSPGGSVFDGYKIVSQMEAMNGPVYTICNGMCASMAAIIHQYGTKRYMTARSMLLFHPASGGARGQLKNMLSILTMIQGIMDKSDAYIVGRSKMPMEEFKRLEAYELWMDSDTSFEKGFADSIVSINVPESSETPMSTNRVEQPTRTQFDF